MSTGLIIAIVAVGLIVVAGLLLAARKGRQKRLDARRHQAREIRREAEVSRAQADHTRAEADERAARARREEAVARERAAAAEGRAREARERHLDAARKDPDADEDEFADHYDRQHGGDGDGGSAGRVRREQASGRQRRR